MTSMKIKLGLPNTHSTATTDVTDPEGAIGTVTSRRGGTVDLDVKEDWKHRLVMQTSDGSLGILKKAKVVPLVDECGITDPLAQVRSCLRSRRTGRTLRRTSEEDTRRETARNDGSFLCYARSVSPSPLISTLSSFMSPPSLVFVHSFPAKSDTHQCCLYIDLQPHFFGAAVIFFLFLLSSTISSVGCLSTGFFSLTRTNNINLFKGF